jgi:hypothetical protein
VPRQPAEETSHRTATDNRTVGRRETVETFATQVGRDRPGGRLRRTRTALTSMTIHDRNPTISRNVIKGGLDGRDGGGDQHIPIRRLPPSRAATIITPALGLGTSSRKGVRRGEGPRRMGGRCCGRRAWGRRRREALGGFERRGEGEGKGEGGRRETHVPALLLLLFLTSSQCSSN